MRPFAIAGLIIGILGTPPSAPAQKLSVGVVGGGSLTDSFQTEQEPAPTGFSATRTYTPSKDYIIGAALEWNFLPHWSLEADGMYRKLHLTYATVLPNGSLNSVSPSPVITWEFPVLAKYKFELWKVKPLLELGPSFRTAGNLNGANPSHVGITSGVGVEMHAGRVKIAPVLRYTRWASDTTFAFKPNSRPDQLELLAGFSVAPESQWRPMGRRFSLGVVIGAELTHDLQVTTINIPSIGYSSSYHPVRTYIAGPSVDFEIRKFLSIELDAVYHPLRSEGATTYNGVTGRVFQSSIATWELPLMAKYGLSTRFGKPFVEAGPSFRLPSGGVSNFGATAAIGFETHLRVLKIAPLIRYTHWTQPSTPGSSVSLPNQAELLVRFSL